MACPPNHTEYLSEMLADNAVILHQMRNAECKAIGKFQCGDHWHIGHSDHVSREQCHATSPRISYPGRRS